jgi:DNA-directed RNA polymerase subunit M/transcription elongation factor TFIIS
MHTGPVPGEYTNAWKPTKVENPKFVCRKCGSDDVWYRKWESSCGGYDDTKYECRACERTWWVEGADA